MLSLILLTWYYTSGSGQNPHQKQSPVRGILHVSALKPNEKNYKFALTRFVYENYHKPLKEIGMNRFNHSTAIRPSFSRFVAYL